MRTPTFVQLHGLDPAPLAAEAAAGLLAVPAQVPPKFFYDALGSRLFDAITELDEYYPTRTEAAIFDAHGAALAQAALAVTGPAPRLVDLGAGNCAKAARLFPWLGPSRYVAVDISADFLRQALAALQREHPRVEMVGLGLDFGARLQLPPEAGDGPALVFYPGSSIGNFAPADARRLLREARAAAAGGALLIGVDLVKPRARLEAAYDDDLGVTAAFNLNLLKHLNRLLGADFDVRAWRHLARFDEQASRIEMHLEARRDLAVHWRGGARRFAAGERIHTENSYKWTLPGFEALLREAGWQPLEHRTDAHGGFALCLAAAGGRGER
jgi:dimethylhistidine N-methyltransferase